MNTKRFIFLDFLRFIAVSLVILHHCFAIIRSNSGIFINNYIYKLIEEHGAWGVKLFFAISGYIIFSKYAQEMPINKFMFLRFTRLWPMLFVSTIISVVLLQFIKFKSFSPLDVIPSLLMLDPTIFSTIFSNIEFSWIDNSYWSLFVEIRFYFLYIVAIRIAKVISVERFLMLFTLFIISQLGYILGNKFHLETITSLIYWLFIPDYLGFFLMGIVMFTLQNNFNSIAKKFSLFLYSVFIIMLSLLRIHEVNSSFDKTVYLFEIILIYFLFFATMLLGEKARLASKAAKYIGRPSYVSYLLHQNLFLFAISFNENPRYIYLFLITYLFFLFSTSYWLNYVIEPKLIRGLRSKFKLYL